MASANTLTLTEKNWDEEVIHSSTPVLVDFWAPWCGPCRMIAPMIDEIADAQAGRAKVGKVNVDDNQALAGRYRVISIPALMIFKDGEVMEQFVGRVDKAVLLSKLGSLAAA